MKKVLAAIMLFLGLTGAADGAQLPTTYDKPSDGTQFLHDVLTATANDIVNICEGRAPNMSPGDRRFNCRVPFIGAVAQLGGSTICMPGTDTNQQVEQALFDFRTWAKQAPDRLGEPALASIVSLLAKKYPCAPASNGTGSTD
jgi:Ssp1 endopeptidase immunity protein Rap1a